MPEKVFLLNKHIFTYFNNKIIECRITSISLGTMDEYLYTVVPINNMGREIKLSEGDMYMTKHELVQELLDKRYVYQDLGSIIEEDIYNNEPYFVDKNLINLNGVARYRYTEEKRNLTEYDEYALIELKKSGLKHLTDTRFIFSKDLLENYVDVNNLILVKELVNNVLVFSLLSNINGLEVVIHNRVTKEVIIAYFKQVTEAIATYPIKYVYGDAVHITRVVNSFVNSGLNTKINSNSSIINISVNDNTFAKEVQEQEIVNSTQPGRELQNYISEKDAIGEEYANNLIGYLKLINSSDYEDISISDGVFIEPVQVLTISIRLNSLEVGDNGNIDITFTLATNDSLPISRTEPLSIDISCLDELNNDSNYFDYDFSIPFTISDFSTNEYTLTLNRDSNKIDENKPVYLNFSTEEEITIENSGFELTVLKSEEEPVEPEQTLTITVTTTVNEATGELTLGTNIVTSDGLPIKRTEPLVIDIVTKDGDTPIEYFIPSSITILDFTNNVNMKENLINKALESNGNTTTLISAFVTGYIPVTNTTISPFLIVGNVTTSSIALAKNSSVLSRFLSTKLVTPLVNESCLAVCSLSVRATIGTTGPYFLTILAALPLLVHTRIAFAPRRFPAPRSSRSFIAILKPLPRSEYSRIALSRFSAVS